jgi:hypothetical protein
MACGADGTSAAAPKIRGTEHRSTEQRGDNRRRLTCWQVLADRDVGQLEIIHYCYWNTSRVEHLPVQQMQVGIPKLAPVISFLRHCPAPVMINSGIAAAEATRMMTI